MRYILPLAVILLFVLGKAATGGGDGGQTSAVMSASQSNVERAANARSASASIGKSVRDGDLAFVVTSVQRPGRKLVSQFGTTETAQGEFVIVRVDVTNVGGEPKTLTATSQLLVNDKGQRFAPSAAITSLKGAERVFLTRINPGSTVAGTPLLFDVDAGTTIVGIELHDSMSSTGVQVALP
jgi:hypothetical protein